jgi:long-chain acyl-CoA synthetase
VSLADMAASADVRVADVIRRAAQSRPGTVALRHGEREVTYAQLDARSNQLAHALQDRGVGAGSRVAYLGRSSPEVIELLGAVSKIGAVVVPLNWRLSPRELAGVIADAQAPLLIADTTYRETAERLVSGSRTRIELRVVGAGGTGGYEQWIAAEGEGDPGGRGQPADVVVQMYTSGTTGTPKGVLTTHRNLAAAASTSAHWGFDETAISLTPLPLFHIGGIGWVYCGLWHAISTILVSEFEPSAMLEMLERHRVTNPIFVPTMLQTMTAVPGARARDYSQLRTIVYGASPITTTALRETLDTFRCGLLGLYGLTESTGGVVHLDPGDHQRSGPRQRLLRSVGRPYEWVQLRICDPGTGAELATGSVGEVWLRGPNVMPGYFRRPQETARALSPDGWLRTGDGGYLDEEGYLFLTDRVKDMIISGGENVYPIEVEEVLAQHPGVADVTVIGVPDARWGEAVLALVIRRSGATVQPAELIAFARERLASYKLPRAVEFVDELPRTPTGKVLKRELRARYTERPATAAVEAYG